MSIVAVIGLVLGISGTAYAAMSALRSNWDSKVVGHCKDANGWFEELDHCADGNISTRYSKHSARFRKAMKTWDRSQWTPMALLGLACLLMTADVCFLDWSTTESIFSTERPPWWHWLYKGGLILMIGADALAFKSMWSSYSVICDSADELQSSFKMCVEQSTKAKQTDDSSSGLEISIGDLPASA